MYPSNKLWPLYLSKSVYLSNKHDHVYPSNNKNPGTHWMICDDLGVVHNCHGLLSLFGLLKAWESLIVCKGGAGRERGGLIFV